MIINDVNSIMRWKASRLPTGYREIPYLETTINVNYIDLGFTGYATIDAEIEVIDESTTASQYLFGTRSTGSNSRFALYIQQGNNYQCGLGGWVSTTISPAYQKVHYNFNPFLKTLEIGNETASLGSGYTTYPPNRTLTLAMYNEANTIPTTYTQGISMKIYPDFVTYNSSNTETHRFLPSIRTADNKNGLYDLIGNSIKALTNFS